MYWEAIPEKAVKGKPKKHIMVTRHFKGAVICVTSVEDSSTSLEKAKELILYAISHIEFMDNKLEAPDLQKALMKGTS